MHLSPDTDFDSFESFLKHICSYAQDLIYSGHARTIYHYSDLGGLQGVIENHDLWLTNSRYSNDDEELNHGFRVVREVIDAQPKKTKTRWQSFLKNVREKLDEPVRDDVYICCFCEEGDVLSQWRGYAANGTGVSIGFDPTGFNYVTGPDAPQKSVLRLWSVFYDDVVQRNIIEQALTFFFEQPWTIDVRVRQAIDALLFFIPTFKHADFREEKELRLIFTPGPGFPTEPRFRVARGMLVPYYSLRALADRPTPHLLPVKDVRIGPSMNKALNAESARRLLAKAGYTEAKVLTSNTPYRG